MYSIIGADGKEYGPVPTDQIRQWISLGRCDSRTLVRSVSSSEWLPLGQVPELAVFCASPSLLPANPPPTSGLAIASLVCGVAGVLICVSAPVGLVLGIIARNRIKQSAGRLSGSGLALAGIITSSVTAAVFLMAFCAGLLLPAFAKARQKAQSIQC